MRRSRAFVVFGGFLAGMALTVSAQSKTAASGSGSGEHAGGAGVWADAEPGDLLPVLAKHEMTAIFGSFVKPGALPAALPTDDPCPSDMVEVEGEYCPSVVQNCLRFLDPDTKLQCAEFEHGPASAICPLKTSHKRFCIDRFEWPNERGALPQYMASWREATASCESIGKRLCADTEWTLACEGPERQPYPYGDGYVRDDRACNIDKPYIWPHPERIFDAKTQDQELAHLDQREPSGTRTSCVSPYGVNDMVGNVDEWVINESQGGKPYRSGLKGGYWGPVRTRCRPMTTAHEESFRYYQIGFRCCGGVRAVEPTEGPLAKR
jgi:sulfatase modifying factor 1